MREFRLDVTSRQSMERPCGDSEGQALLFDQTELKVDTKRCI